MPQTVQKLGIFATNISSKFLDLKSSDFLHKKLRKNALQSHNVSNIGEMH